MNEPSLKAAQREEGREGGREGELSVEHGSRTSVSRQVLRGGDPASGDVDTRPTAGREGATVRQAWGQPTFNTTLSAELVFEVYIDIDTARVGKNQSTNNREEALKPAVSLAALVIN